MTTEESQLADRLVSIVVVVFLVKAAGVVLLLASATVRSTVLVRPQVRAKFGIR